MGLLDGKRVVVTGGGRGLGRAYALALAREGARLVVNDVDADESQAVANEISAQGGEALASDDDVADWDAARRLVERCVDHFGGIDTLVNNAGVYAVAPVLEATEQDFDRIISVNLKGTFNMTRHAVGPMVRQKAGCVINVTSGAQTGLLDRSIYGASKGGIASFTYAWALELAPYGIRVNAVSPLARTRMSDISDAGGQPTRAQSRPENVAPLVVFLASDDASSITGQVVRLDGNALSIVSHPRPVRPAVRDEGWSVEALCASFMDTLGGHLEPVGQLAERYEYAEGLG